MTPEVLLLAFALGLRHALDPDHLVAVASLGVGDRSGRRRAAALGAWWGAGHATSLLLAGIALITLGASLPPGAETALEAAVGALIILLAARIVWPRRHAATLGHLPRRRGRGTAFGVGLLHGLAGSGGVALVVVATLPADAAMAALSVFAPATALSMASASGGFAWLAGRAAALSPVATARALPALLPAAAAAGMAFGFWYLLAAVGA